MSGSVISDRLQLTGVATLSDANAGIVVTINVTNWNAFLSNSQMFGTIDITSTINILPGTGVVKAHLTGLTR